VYRSIGTGDGDPYGCRHPDHHLCCAANTHLRVQRHLRRQRHRHFGWCSRLQQPDPVVCTTNGGSTITMLGAGTCTIAANQPGNANYAPAPQVTQNITIAPGTQAALVLSASPPSIALGRACRPRVSYGPPAAAARGPSSPTISISGPCEPRRRHRDGHRDRQLRVQCHQGRRPQLQAVSSTSNNVTVVVTAEPPDRQLSGQPLDDRHASLLWRPPSVAPPAP
jgi:hypothetical protein